MSAHLPSSGTLCLFIMLCSCPEWRYLLSAISKSLRRHSAGLQDKLAFDDQIRNASFSGQVSWLSGFLVSHPGGRRRSVVMTTAFFVGAESSTSTYQQKETGTTSLSWTTDPDHERSTTSYDHESSSIAWTADPDHDTGSPVSDYSQTILVIGVTVAFALTLAIGGSIAAGICRADNKQTVNPEERTGDSEMDREYVQRLHQFAMQIPSGGVKTTGSGNPKLFTGVQHGSAFQSRRIAAPTRGLNGHVTSAKSAGHVIVPQRVQKQQHRKAGRSGELALQLSDGVRGSMDPNDGLTTARDIVIEDL